MDRVNSKTQDAYVEFETLKDAMAAVARFQNNAQRGRATRLGDRPIDVGMSSQDQLMRDLFPIAAGVDWKGGRPTIKNFEADQPWNNFKSFVTTEELIMLIKHVEVPSRVSLPRNHPPFFCA
jgi:hypothetical protein